MTVFIGPDGADPDELGDPHDPESGWKLLSPRAPDYPPETDPEPEVT